MIVLGAGVIGAAVAFELSAAGHRVRVIEARNAGRGATQASAGVLAPYIEGHDSPVLSALGRRSLDLYDDLIARVVAASERPIVYERHGTLEVALNDDHADRLRRSATARSGDAVAAHWLDAAAITATEPALSSSACGALFTAIHGYVAAGSLTDALVAAAARHGAIFDYGTRALAVARDGDLVRVQTDAGAWHGEYVVLAAGSWSGEIAATGAAPVPVRPMRGQLLVLRQPVPTLRRVVWGQDCYLVPWPDGTVLVGATMEDVGFDERATVAGVAGLMQAAWALVPGLQHAAFEAVRVGLRPASPDGLPLVGVSRHVPGLIHASGHFRNGLLLAPLTARLVHDLVNGHTGDTALPALSPARVGL